MDWFEIWKSDKENMIAMMLRNMMSDLENGYSWTGSSITNQRHMIDEYEKEFDLQMKALGLMDARKVNHWCYMDLKRRGAIS